MIRKKWVPFLRYPKTTQELRANQDSNDPLVRAKRRNLPTSFDDNFIRKQQGWKYLGYKKQYKS